MRKIWLVLMVLVGGMMLIQGCTNQWTEESYSYYSPAWTPEGKIAYFESWTKAYYKEYFFGVGEKIYRWDERYVLKEMNDNGGGDRTIIKLYDGTDAVYSPMGGNISISSDEIVFAYQPATYNYDKSDTMIYTINRDGTRFKELCIGKYPNFFTGGDSIIYEKPGEGIWVMDGQGNGQRQVISDSNAKQPDVNRNDDWIVYCKIETLKEDSVFVLERSNNIKTVLFNSDRLGGPHFATLSDSVIFGFELGIQVIPIDGSEGRNIYDRDFGWVRLSNDDTKFVGSNRDEIYVMNSDGSNKKKIK